MCVCVSVCVCVCVCVCARMCIKEKRANCRKGQAYAYIMTEEQDVNKFAQVTDEVSIKSANTAHCYSILRA